VQLAWLVTAAAQPQREIKASRPKREGPGAFSIHVGWTCIWVFSGSQPDQNQLAKQPTSGFRCFLVGPRLNTEKPVNTPLPNKASLFFFFECRDSSSGVFLGVLG
jgi:hypothetical protein